MTAAYKIAIETSTERAPRHDAEKLAASYVIVDVAAAEIVSANAAGAEAFGIFSYATYPIAIEPNLSGIARLRNLLPNLVNPCCESLMFRRGGRLRSMKFRISRASRDSASSKIRLEIVDDSEPNAPQVRVLPDPETDWEFEHKSRPQRKNDVDPLVAIVSALEKKAPVDATPSKDATSSEPPRADARPVEAPPSRNDADTLKQIAQRIREDTAFVKPPPPETNSGAASASTASTPTPDEPPANAIDEPSYAPRKTAAPLDPDHLARLAHELKTPITAIAAAAEVMRDERLGPVGNSKYLEYAADIHESAHHALDVITKLLAESGKSGDHAARLIALDLNAVVDRTVSSVQALAEMHRISLAFDPQSGEPHVIANPTAIRQILLNLLTNAIKFTPAGGDIRVATGYLPDGRVFLVVRDTGCGMTGKKTPTSNAETTSPSTRLGGGNGLGLPLVRRLVSELGAELEIDSAADKGTVVLIAFGGYARWHGPT